MAKRTKELGLGRGLNALLGDPDLQAQGEGSVSLPHFPGTARPESAPEALLTRMPWPIWQSLSGSTVSSSR